MLPGTNVSTNSSISNPRIFYGWFVVAGTFAVTFVGFGCAYSFSAFLLPLQHDFAASRGSIALVFSIAGFFYFALGVITGPLADRFGSRPLAAAMAQPRRKCFKTTSIFQGGLALPRPSGRTTSLADRPPGARCKDK